MTVPEIEQGLDTRQRLIDASTEMFVEQGFGATTVRDIATRAGANIAAVNYHFGSKEGLYAAVIQYHAAQAIEYISQDGKRETARTAEVQLRKFVSNFLQRLLVNTPQFRMGKLIAREMIEPTAAFELIVEKFVRPQSVALHGLIRSLVGDFLPEETVRRCGLSVVGQCLYYQCARRVVGFIDPEFCYEPGDIERLADHVVEFSLGGLRHMARMYRPGGRLSVSSRKSRK